MTGATGLLGGYLVRDCARYRLPLAVVARASRRESAQQRIESMLAGWEGRLGYALPRPVVLEGDLTQPFLGLNKEQVGWVREHCSAVLHNAASLSFVKTRDGEPFRSNVDGTRHVLELASAVGIRRFHHVSTAYVCGLREGTILESDLDVGQTPGNVYEESKIASEGLVAASEFLDSPTVFRPGIIIGDSRTGFSSSFHGFYAPLRVALAMADRVSDKGEVGQGYGREILQLFQLSGDEAKNFVPVDWVSAVMTRVLANPELQGRVYHLTPSNAITLQEMTQVMFDVVHVHGQKNRSIESGRAISRTSFERSFLDQLAVYKSYWRDDPIFDQKNTLEAVPDLPCPQVDREMLLRMCVYAIQSGFGVPAPAPLVPEFDVAQHLSGSLERARIKDSTNSTGSGFLKVGLRVTGAGGGEWELETQQEHLLASHPGVSEGCETLLHLNSITFGKMVARQIDLEHAIRSGAILVEGKPADATRAVSVLRQIAS